MKVRVRLPLAVSLAPAQVTVDNSELLQALKIVKEEKRKIKNGPLVSYWDNITYLMLISVLNTQLLCH